MDVTPWIDGEEVENTTDRLIMIAFALGWEAKDDEVDIVALAIRDLFGDPDLSEDEKDRLAFRYPGWAEAWLNDTMAPDGFTYGWHDDSFYFQPDQWWAQYGGPDQLWLP